MKYTLKEKIARATARVSATCKDINGTKTKILTVQNLIHVASQEISWCLDNGDEKGLRFWAKSRRNYEEQLALAELRLPTLEKWVINQRAYLRKLQAAQSKIDAEMAQEEAEINMLIAYAGAIV